jgi:hypothetical protein
MEDMQNYNNLFKLDPIINLIFPLAKTLEAKLLQSKTLQGKIIPTQFQSALRIFQSNIQ